MSARNETLALMQRFGARNIFLGFDDANALRRAQLTLHRWAEQECGDGNDYVSWCIERDDETNIPFMVYHRFTESRPERVRIADREAGALARVVAICKRTGLHFYYQTDPRGCALYVSSEPLLDHQYSNGVACC